MAGAIISAQAAMPRSANCGFWVCLVLTSPVLAGNFQHSVNAVLGKRRRGDGGFYTRGRAAMATAMTEAAIRIDAVSKTYAGGKQALDNVSFDVPRGQIFGLLGPNGAGKSTLINILAGLVNKTAGHASIWGFDIDADPRNAKYSIGIGAARDHVRSVFHAL